MFEQITIYGKKNNLAPVEEQERIFICEIDGKKYYLGPEAHEKMTWEEAIGWAKSVGGQLMPREVGFIAFKKEEVRKLFRTESYWLDDEYGSSYAWFQGFDDGYQFNYNKAFSLYVRAVFVETALKLPTSVGV